jgi:hypothetical protein|tara:strand:- start:88 stop:360 length:273 start_codon:yes stop_codon:yes gene_type:complete
MALDGLYTKENIFAEFKKLKSNKEKAKFLRETKELKQQHPQLFRNLKISLKQFDNLIREWESPKPFARMLKEISDREERELKLEKAKKGD